MLHLLLAIAALQCPDGTPPPCRIAAAAPRAAVPAGSIAVFPFANRSPDSSDAYLADALAEQIIGRLARVGDLRVKSATAVSAQWRRTPDPITAARALRVEWFVSGSIRRVGRQLAVSAELVRATSGDGAWSAPFRRGDDDLAAIEEQIAESVAVGIIGRLAPTQAAALRGGGSRNPEAYRLYLYGRALVARRTTEDIARATDVFGDAVRLDPNYAPAWARLGNTRALQVQWGGAGTLTTDSLLALSSSAVGRALRLDSMLGEAWFARGQNNVLRGDLHLAHADLERALRLDSLSADTWHGVGYLYSVDLLALPEVGEIYFRRAVSLDPDLRNSWRHLALLRRAQGRLAEAEALLDTSLARGPWLPGFTERSYVRHLRGNAAGALSDLADAERLGTDLVGSIGVAANMASPRPLGALLRAAYRVPLGDSAEAGRRLARARAAADSGRWDYLALTVLAMVLGQHDAALAALERMRREADPNEPRCGPAPCSASLRTWTALHDPVFGPLSGTLRFQALLEETRPRVPWLGR